MFLNPFGLVGIVSIAVHEVGVHYLRDQLNGAAELKNRLILCIPGTVLPLYKKRYGRDSAVKFVITMRFIAFGSFVIDMIVYNRSAIFR